MSQTLLPEFDQEMSNTRRTLERVPEDRLDWRPHPKSPTLGWLAGHVANLPTWTIHTLEKDSLDLQPAGGPPPRAPEPRTRQELLAFFDRNRDAARAVLERADDARFLQPWSLMKGGRTLFTLPKAAVLRSFVMNHLIHHRAQLGVYLRLNDVPVPALHGPSADEGQM